MDYGNFPRGKDNQKLKSTTNVPLMSNISLSPCRDRDFLIATALTLALDHIQPPVDLMPGGVFFVVR
jgi:hypothetical protein